ncbi:MAG TPA: ABC transporter ATP-binding protein [Caulobacteraceae bacterium]|nr:ABC transporter ATP-binding protein [Caulobacteraceae bacterium]
MSLALELHGVSVRLGGRAALDGVSLAVAPGEVVGVVGANGSGKTTLLRAALGLVRLSAGKALLAGRAAHKLSEPARAGLAAYLPQERRVGWNLPAWRVAALGAPNAAPAAARQRAMAALTEVGVEGVAERGVLDLSGGERARALLARLFVARAPLLVVDEPTAGLDADAALLVIELLRGAAAEGRGVLIAVHDLTLAVRGCDRLAVLAQGRLMAIGPPRRALSSETLRQAFGLAGEILDTPAGVVVAGTRALRNPSTAR